VARRLRGHPGLRALVASGCSAPALQPAEKVVRAATVQGREFAEIVASYGGLPPEIVADEELHHLLFPSLRADVELIAGYRGYLDANPDDSVWIVFDGPKESVVNEGRLRISYTGGLGPHRADKFICDYLRAAKYLGLSGRIEVKTNDRDIRKTACACGACCK
jgi:hypothetical protein